MARRFSIDAFYAALWALLIAKLLLARQMMLGEFGGIGALSDIAVITACVVLCAAVGGTVGRRLLVIAAVAVSFLAVGSVMYAATFEHVPGAQTLALSGQLAGLGEATADMWKWSYAFYFIDLPLVLFFGLRSQEKLHNYRARFAVAGVVALVLPLLFATTASAAKGIVDSRVWSYRVGVISYQVSTFMPHPKQEEVTADASNPAAELQERIDTFSGREKGAMRKPGAPAAGALKGKNIVVIQVEALQNLVVGESINGRAITPSLNALIAESSYYPNTYSQIGRGNTSDAEFITNTSLYPAMETPSSLAYAKKDIPSLPKLLREQGYATMTFHANDVTFWNREQLYQALGFEEFYDRTFYKDEDMLGYGSSDMVLFERGLFKLIEAREANKPFYAQFITVSSHYPFRDAAARGTIPLEPEVADSQTGRYIEAVNYTDQQIGWFIEQLRATGLLEDTIVVVYGDHFGLRFDNDTDIDRQVRSRLGGHEYNRADYYNIPMIIRIPGAAPCEDHTVLGQIDVMPTLADLLGLDLSQTPHFGRSAMVQTPTMLTRSSSIPTYITDDTMLLQGVTNGEDRWYDPRNQAMTSPRLYPDNLEHASQLIQLSNSYAASLPERPDASDEVGHIPTIAFKVERTPFK